MTASSGQPRPLLAAIICRVSTRQQVDGTSLDEQERLCRVEADSMGANVVYVGRDEGISGGELDRDALQTALDLASRGEVNVILVHHQDRLARDEFVRYMAEREMKSHGVIYRPLNLPANVDPFDEKDGEMTAGIFGIMAQYQRRQNQWRSANGQRAKARDGRWPGGEPPYGYQLEGKGTRDCRPVPHPDEREVLRIAVDAVMRHGKTTGEVAALLNGLGFTGRRGGQWTHQNLRRTLENEALTGRVDWGKPTRRHGHNTKTKPDGTPKYGETVTLWLADPPLTRETWEELQHVLKSRGYGFKADAKPYPNSGALTSCGGRLGGVYRADRDLRQYRCNRNKWVAGNPPLCDCARLNADRLDWEVWSAVIEVLADPKRLMGLAADYLGLREVADQPEAETLTQIDAKIAKLERSRVQTVTDYIKAGIDPEVVKQASAKIEAELAAAKSYRRQLEAFRADAEAEQERAGALVELAKAAAERLPNMTLDEQREVLRILNVEVTLLDPSNDPRLRIEGVVPGGADLFGDGWDSRVPSAVGASALPRLGNHAYDLPFRLTVGAA